LTVDIAPVGIVAGKIVVFEWYCVYNLRSVELVIRDLVSLTPKTVALGALADPPL
jgi:hypothetical protein